MSAFRLFSGSAQPKPILLAPKIKSWIAYVPCPCFLLVRLGGAELEDSPKGPSREDNAEEAERRASRARSIAVDYTWVMTESMKPDVVSPWLYPHALVSFLISVPATARPSEVGRAPSRRHLIFRCASTCTGEN